VINQLKHRILVFLYKRACKLAELDGNPYEIRRFYQYFDQLRSLRIWKMQLLDENHLLIKYASEEVVTLRSSEPNSQASFFIGETSVVEFKARSLCFVKMTQK
jgi:de-etiolated-1